MYDVVIVGGGPAGLMAAYQLTKANVSFVLLEKNSLLGKKLLLTGQGRCNVTNHLPTNQFISQLTLPHKKFLYSTLHAFGTKEVIAFFQENGVPLYQDGSLKYFPKSNKAMDVRDVFRTAVQTNVVLNTDVKRISLDKHFTISTNHKTYQAKNVLIATGSTSFPQTGSTGKGSVFAHSFGIQTTDFYPAETSLYSSFIRRKKEYLQGVSIQQSLIQIKGTKIKTKGDLLFTHFGLSGPSIFHISEYVYHELLKGPCTLFVQLSNASQKEVRMEFEQCDPKVHLVKFLEQFTVKRVVKFLLEYLKFENVQIGTLSNKSKARIIELLFQFPIPIDNVETIEKAYVNGGGVLTTELNPKTFESKDVKGLYFIGETVDVHGPIGGFNVTIALSMGYSAAQAIIGGKVS